MLSRHLNRSEPIHLAQSLILAACLAPWAFAQVTVEWLQPTRGVSIAVTDSNHVYTLDYEQILGSEMVVTRRDVNGALLWQSSFDQTVPTQWERTSWVTTDSQGNAIACGTVMSGFSNPVEAASVVMKLAPDGDVLWRHVYETGFDGSSARRCLVDGEDNIYVLGRGVGPSGLVTKVKAFAPDGSTLWTWFDTDGIGSPIHFKLTPDDHIVIAGRGLFGAINGYAKLSLAGQKVWSLAGVQSFTVGDVAGDASGHSWVVHHGAASNSGTRVKRLDPAGVILWDKTFAHTGFRIEVGPDGSAIVAGFPSTSTGGAAFIKVDPAGDMTWSNPDADGPLVLLLHSQLLVDDSGDAYLAASTLFDMAVCKVGSDGSSRWTTTVPGSSAAGMALSRHDDSLFVVGGRTTRWSDAEEGPWHDLGLPLAGGAGEPFCSGEGSLVVGTTVGLSLSSVLPSEPLALVLGASLLGAPFKGGTLLPHPDVLLTGLVSQGSGRLLLSDTWPPGIPAGTDIWFQFWMQDPAGSHGFAASNGLRATCP